MSILRVEHLTYTYSPSTPFEHIAVSDVSFSVEKGEFIGIIGHTGSGKSTLVQTLNGLLKPTSGKIYFNDKEIWEKPKEIRQIRFNIGLVFQYPEYQLFEETVYKDIAFGPTNMGLSEEQTKESVLKAAKFVGLKDELLEKSPFDLSGGEKRRAAIAGVIAMDPDVLILDEPTAGLDPMGRDLMLSQIRAYHRARGNTVLLVSHSMEDVASVCDKVLVMNRSKLWDFDQTDRVFSKEKGLAQIGLRVPQVTAVTDALRQKGIPIREGILTVDEAVVEITEFLKREGRL